MKVKLLSSLLFFVCCSSSMSAQVEYLVKVNPTTCNYTILDSIPIIKWISIGSSTFDKTNKRFVFIGLDNGSSRYLCSVDATNGKTVSIPSMTGNFGCMKFDNSTGILYGIRWTTSLANAEFVIINPTNLSYSVIRQINLTSIGSDFTFDDINHRYIIAAGDSIGTHCLFSIDVATGNIISKPAISGVGGIQFDNSSGNLYGLHWDNSIQTEYFVSVNMTNGSLTKINSIPLATSVAMGYQTFDETNKRYTFLGIDNSNNRYLFTLDATNGSVVTNPPYPAFTAPYNLTETEYDNSTGNLYALHWGPKWIHSGIENYEEGTIQISPNPFSIQTTLQTGISLKKTSLTVYNSFGQSVKNMDNLSEKNIIFQRENLPAGLYFIRLIQEGKVMATDKLIIID